MVSRKATAKALEIIYTAPAKTIKIMKYGCQGYTQSTRVNNGIYLMIIGFKQKRF